MWIEGLISNSLSADSLRSIIDGARFMLAGNKHVVTVCQHVEMLKYQEIFRGIGITDVFWSHAVKDQNYFPADESLKIFSFPLFPAKAPLHRVHKGFVRKYLYSLIELNIKSGVSRGSVKMIMTHLTGKPKSFVFSHKKCDFTEVIYCAGTRDEVCIDQEAIDQGAPIDIGRILQQSVFTICPAGFSTNSIRLWESIACGAIPVVLSDDFCLPGSRSLWEEAIVLCPERQKAVKALPEQLEKIAGDEELLGRKRQALKQLWLLYGPEYFIYDIYKLFLSFAQDNSVIDPKRSSFSYGRILALASIILRDQDVENADLDTFIAGCSSRVITDPSGFKSLFDDHLEFRKAYNKALNLCSRRYSESMHRNLKFSNVALN